MQYQDLEKKLKELNWKVIGAVTAAVVILGGGVYFLFFSPTPVIEVIIPPAVRSTSELSNIRFDPGPVAQSLSTKFKNYAGKPAVGKAGRRNPFIEF